MSLFFPDKKSRSARRSFVVLILLAVLALPGSLFARMKNPCAEIPASLRPPPETVYKAPVTKEWKSIKDTLTEVDQEKFRPREEEHKDPVLEFNLNELPGTGPIAFTGRTGVRSRILFYFPGDRLNCVVVESRSLEGGSKWDYGYFLLPVTDSPGPVFIFRGPSRAPYPPFEQRDLTEQLFLLRQVHKNVRAALYFLERKRVSEAGRFNRDNDWQIGR